MEHILQTLIIIDLYGMAHWVGDRIGRRRPILLPILALINLWVWPIYWATGQLIAGRSPLPRDGKTADLYQACLIFHCRLIA